MNPFPLKAKDLDDQVYRLLDLANTFLEYHDEWADDRDSPDVPNDGYWDRCEALINAWCDTAIPQLFRGQAMEIAINELKSRFYEHDGPAVKDVFFSAVSRLKDSIRDFYRLIQTKHYVEPVAALNAGGVSLNQICMMYGWMDEWGNPQVKRATDEIANPGSVVGPDWKHPYEVEREEFLAAFQTGQRSWRPAEATPPPEPKPHDVTWEELMDMDVFPEQAAKMKLTTVEEAQAEYDRIRKIRANGDPDGLNNLSAEELKQELHELGVAYKAKTPKPVLVKKVRAAREALA